MFEWSNLKVSNHGTVVYFVVEEPGFVAVTPTSLQGLKKAMAKEAEVLETGIWELRNADDDSQALSIIMGFELKWVKVG